jgi:hypothetical protein
MKALFHVLCGVAILVGTAQLFEARPAAFGICCDQGYQCSGDRLCCPPGVLNALPCSPGDLDGYCLTIANCYGEEGG